MVTLESATRGRAIPRLYDFDEGLGSVYGRYVRKHLCQRLIADHAIGSVLEAPCNAESYFASPGTQSVVFAQHGCDVTLVHSDNEIIEKTRTFWEEMDLSPEVLLHEDLYHLPFDDRTFDLVWNFDHVPLVDDPARLIAEMARVSNDLVMVIVPNRSNFGYPIHAMLNRLSGRSSPWGSGQWMATNPIHHAFRRLGWQVIEVGLVDAPPWPGFDALHVLGQFVRRKTVATTHRDSSDAEVEHMLRKLTFIEYGPFPHWLKFLFAHQLVVIARRPRP